jgi:hypothetical protein
MDINDVQKSLPRYLIVKKRAALGNFFGTFRHIFMIPYML